MILGRNVEQDEMTSCIRMTTLAGLLLDFVPALKLKYPTKYFDGT